jgi:hypothetical protein
VAGPAPPPIVITTGVDGMLTLPTLARADA